MPDTRFDPVAHFEAVVEFLASPEACEDRALINNALSLFGATLFKGSVDRNHFDDQPVHHRILLHDLRCNNALKTAEVVRQHWIILRVERSHFAEQFARERQGCATVMTCRHFQRFTFASRQ